MSKNLRIRAFWSSFGHSKFAKVLGPLLRLEGEKFLEFFFDQNIAQTTRLDEWSTNQPTILHKT